MIRNVFPVTVLALANLLVAPGIGDEPEITNCRRPADEAELRSWLENMIWHHRFSVEEIQAATGLSDREIQLAATRFNIYEATRPKRTATSDLLVLPYPGGRHPRIGFLDGAIRPQRETKVSIFTPWDDSSYVVVDVPEAIWSNLGLTYLAHTHIPTVWDQRSIRLTPREWRRNADGSLVCERTLPNGIKFGTRVRPGRIVRMEMWLTNGTDKPLSDLRVQNCVMLKGAKGFAQQTNDNKLYRKQAVACHSPDRQRWILTGWTPLHRGWANDQCPCLHSDPKFPDCAPGETQHLSGWLTFYKGDDVEREIDRVVATVQTK